MNHPGMNPEQLNGLSSVSLSLGRLATQADHRKGLWQSNRWLK